MGTPDWDQLRSELLEPTPGCSNPLAQLKSRELVDFFFHLVKREKQEREERNYLECKVETQLREKVKSEFYSRAPEQSGDRHGADEEEELPEAEKLERRQASDIATFEEDRKNHLAMTNARIRRNKARYEQEWVDKKMGSFRKASRELIVAREVERQYAEMGDYDRAEAQAQIVAELEARDRERAQSSLDNSFDLAQRNYRERQERERRTIIESRQSKYELMLARHEQERRRCAIRQRVRDQQMAQQKAAEGRRGKWMDDLSIVTPKEKREPTPVLLPALLPPTRDRRKEKVRHSFFVTQPQDPRASSAGFGGRRFDPRREPETCADSQEKPVKAPSEAPGDAQENPPEDQGGLGGMLEKAADVVAEKAGDDAAEPADQSTEALEDKRSQTTDHGSVAADGTDLAQNVE